MTNYLKDGNQNKNKKFFMITNKPEDAPKDGSVFLADIGWPSYVACMWSVGSLKWVYAMPQIGLIDGEWTDSYFENEWGYESELKGWLPIPPVQH